MREKIKSKFDKKTLIWMGAALIALILVVVAIINANQIEPIDDNYFADDDHKTVLTLSADAAAFEDSEYEPRITQIVYENDDAKKITGVRVFYVYDNDEAAREASRNVTFGNWAASKKLNGRYIIFTSKSDQYKDMTVSDVLENRESLREAGALVE